MKVQRAIKKKYTGFSVVNKKIADYFLSHPQGVIQQTSSEIASAVGVSPASIVRFVKKIGFKGLDEVRVLLATQQALKGDQKEIDPIIAVDDTLLDMSEKIKVLIKDTADDTFLDINFDILQIAIEKIRKARTVYLFGIGASSLPAYDLFHKLNRSGKQSSFVFDPHIGIEMLSYATAEDVVIAFSYSGDTKEILLACEYGKHQGANVIIVTRNHEEKIQKLADQLLTVPNNEHLLRVGAISSMYSSMMIGTILYLGTIQDKIDSEIESRMKITREWVIPLKDEKNE